MIPISPKLIASIAFVALILGAVAYAMHIGAEYEKCQTLAAKQRVDIATQVENEKKLVEALDEQTKASRDAEAASTAANALYDELMNEPRPVRIVPRDRIVEVIRPGDCDRAALDGWDLLNEKGLVKWTSSSSRGSDYWRDYYLEQARRAVPQEPVQVVIHVSQPLNQSLMQSRFHQYGPHSNLSPMLNSGFQVSAEIKSPLTGLR